MLFAFSANAQNQLGDVRWELTELNGKARKDARVYIEFDEQTGKFSGSTGCNRMFGSFELTGDVFKTSSVGTTKMACMRPGVMEKESAFVKALGAANKLKQSGATLMLYVGNRRVMKLMKKQQRFEREPVTMDLTVKKWMLRSISGKPVSLSKDAPFLNFDSEKRSAGGNSGCNVFGGNYEALGSTIKFSNMIATMRACEFEDRMTIERGFLDGLQNADRFEIKGNKLHIYKAGDVLLEFEGVAK